MEKKAVTHVPRIFRLWRLPCYARLLYLYLYLYLNITFYRDTNVLVGSFSREKSWKIGRPRHHCSCSPSKSPVSDDVLGVITFWISYHFHTDGRINFANRDRHISPDRFGANRPKLIAPFGNRLIFRCENHKPSPRRFRRHLSFSRRGNSDRAWIDRCRR